MKLEHLTPAQAAIFRVIRQHGETSRGRIIETLCRKGPHKMPEGTISSCLSRLEGFGFIARPDEAAAGWRLTPEGVALFADAEVADWRLTPEGVALFADAEVEVVDPPLPGAELPEPAPAPFIVSGLDTLRALIDPLLPPPAAEALVAEHVIDFGQHKTAAVEPGPPAPPPTQSPIDPWIIEAHLEFVRAQLAAPPTIPREAARVYREIVQVLPLSLVEALLPITRLVESRS